MTLDKIEHLDEEDQQEVKKEVKKEVKTGSDNLVQMKNYEMCFLKSLYTMNDIKVKVFLE